MVVTPSYMAAIFAGHRNALVRRLYAGVFPLVREKMKLVHMPETLMGPSIQ